MVEERSVVDATPVEVDASPVEVEKVEELLSEVGIELVEDDELVEVVPETKDVDPMVEVEPDIFEKRQLKITSILKHT